MRLDPSFLEAARQGGAPSLERLLTLARPNLRRYAVQSCAASDVEDAVQESLILIYRRFSSLRALGSFSSWVFQIVRRECLRILWPSHKDLESSQVERYLAQRSDDELRVDLALAIQCLPDLYRDVLLLRDLEELTIGEIGARLGLVSETVKTRLYRGRQLLREHLLS